MVILNKYYSMKEEYEILNIEIKDDNLFVSVKLIRNGSVEIFNYVPIQNIPKIIKNFSLVTQKNLMDN
ncbi:hypothetical protein SIFV0021 [Sulfolobus islandicus filamentous virus]|uniref:Uncharacterized protein 21 n=1 Tax=Sulfolobus islandicus filamentous virus (isolate Iceland/Hveragerdi) TaxID=654908 RepID=Y021_SIFVH|nr:hypothetical protein SIFV0021 [Sulfolobus islandicus filamentous virus]Q914K9.1 RecName: Full=Uncharacterized protein 21 [Sulfolobus islandicus filamentous virus (isolate Hveragerdi)]AAL27732.1 hypothetical protein [Sulfolobus islandicus filamentous virus]